MWAGLVPFNKLQEISRWKVEFFSNGAQTKIESIYPIAPIRSLVTERRDSISPNLFPNKKFNYLGLENVQTLTGDLVSFKPVFGNDIRSRSKVFLRGDVLYGKLRPYLNKVFVAHGEIEEGISSSEFFVLIPNTEKILPNLLRNILASRYVLNVVEKCQTGAALPRLQLEDLLEIKIPLPPMEIQLELENFLINENLTRRKLAQELDNLPKMTMDKLINALENGESPFSS